MNRARMEAFSDGVMAVVITLLVLDLHTSAESQESLAEQLRHQWPAFAAYVVSFFVVGVIWVNHHGVARLLSTVDRTMLFLNLLLLFWVTTIPFTTSTLAEFLQRGGSDGRIAVLLYGLTMEGMAVSFTLMFRRLLRAGLTATPVPVADGRRALRRFGAGLLLYPLITAVGLFSAGVMLILLALMTAWYVVDQTPLLPGDVDNESGPPADRHLGRGEDRHPPETRP